ncbi:MAG TPA: NAD-binding protein [Candidatus Cloacimonadota bacterium]|nr:NAD-binding protein [Candidatus Cloacimonadota bacterium]
MKAIIAGSGITVYFLAKRFVSKGYSLVIISNVPEDCDYYSRYLKALVIKGDCTDPEILKQGDVHSANILIGMTTRDQDNLAVCQLAKLYYKVPRILAVVNDPDNAEVFSKLGIRAVSSCNFLIQSLDTLTVLDEIKQQISVVEGKVMMTELEITHKAKCAGMYLKDITLPMSALVICIMREDEVIIPRGNTKIMIHDRVFLITLPDNHSVVLGIFSE